MMRTRGWVLFATVAVLLSARANATGQGLNFNKIETERATAEAEAVSAEVDALNELTIYRPMALQWLSAEEEQYKHITGGMQ